MPGDLELLPSSAAGPALLATELLGRVRAKFPVIGGLEERDQVLVAAWLTGLRSARTRRAYAGDVTAWLGWLAGRDRRRGAGSVGFLPPPLKRRTGAARPSARRGARGCLVTRG
jgi:hypothetical protein